MGSYSFAKLSIIAPARGNLFKGGRPRLIMALVIMVRSDSGISSPSLMDSGKKKSASEKIHRI